MKKVIKLKESDLKNFISKILLEKKIFYKRVWDKEDQILAMFNSRFGVRELGVTSSYVANNVIGTTTNSFNLSTLNFDSMDGKVGLKNYNKINRKPLEILPVQLKVHEEFKDVPKEEFKKICLNIIKEKEKIPNNYTIGQEIGSKRDQIDKEREDALIRAGKDPKKFNLVKSEPAFTPNPDEYEDDEEDEPTNEPTNEPINTPTSKKTSKDEIHDFLLQLFTKAKNSNPDLADDIQFITDYIDSELVDKGTLSEIRKLFKISITESKTNKMKKVIRIKESDIKNIVKKIIKEQGFDDFDDDNGDYDDGEISNKEYARRQEKKFYETKSEILPEKVKAIIKKCEHFFNCKINEEEILLRDRGGNVYAKGPGVSVTHTTSSVESGPSHDYSDEIMSILTHSGFQSANSFGDNGMDGNDGQDTYWTYEYIYKPLVKNLYENKSPKKVISIKESDLRKLIRTSLNN